MDVALAPWRSPLSRNLHLHRSQPESRYIQLATVSPAGLPSNRTVVFRGFRNGTNDIQIISDRRSEKIIQLQHSPYGEICWYFPKTREQFRIFGEIVVITADTAHEEYQNLREKLWQSISDSARQQFTWAQPASPRPEDGDFPVGTADPVMPVENFCLLLLIPSKCDHLLLKGNPQNRYLYLRQGWAWQVEHVYP
jgi:pyridoxamine 5'-phosphate oxidase